MRSWRPGGRSAHNQRLCGLSGLAFSLPPLSSRRPFPIGVSGTPCGEPQHSMRPRSATVSLPCAFRPMARVTRGFAVRLSRSCPGVITSSADGCAPKMSGCATSTALPSPPARRSLWRPCRSTSTPSRSAAPRLDAPLLQFIASRSQDADHAARADGGAFTARAWFEGVSLDDAGVVRVRWPAGRTVKRFGPAYRYPAAGWIYLHIEGKPYERGYQHG